MNECTDVKKIMKSIPIVLANKDNLKPYATIIDDQVDESNPLKIPYYSTVVEGGNIENATWKDQACVRTVKVKWRDDLSISWLERHMEMTQGFIVMGKNPALFVLGEATHDRSDLSKKKRSFPDFNSLKAFIVPAGVGLILKIGTWHDFPVSCGLDVTCFVINTKEVVDALAKMKEPAPMNHGDCYKLRVSDIFDFKIKFPDPRKFITDMGLTTSPVERKLMGKLGYGVGMERLDILDTWGKFHGETSKKDIRVFVIPVVNVEVFKSGCGGPGIQPHLQSNPELANTGWRNYGNNCGLRRLVKLFKTLGIQATAVINSQAVLDLEVEEILKNSGWELGAHGVNNSEGNAHMTRTEEELTFKTCLDKLHTSFGIRPTTWLTPGFSVTERTPEIAHNAGITVLLDFVDDDFPYF